MSHGQKVLSTKTEEALSTKIRALVDAYAEAHSTDALAEDAHFERRLFVRGVYSCPQQIGNRLHHFMNGFAAAVITNRTFLWHYCDIMDGVCPLSGTEADCDKVLHRKRWVPQFEAFAADMPVSKVYSSNYPQLCKHDSTYLFPGLTWDAIPDKVINFGVLEGTQMGCLSNEDESYLLGREAHQRAKLLFALGTDFCFGVLFHSLFSFTGPALRKASAAIDPVPDFHDRFSIALHSRHSHPDNIGGDIALESQCLRQIVLDKPLTSGPCVVLIMSDRNETRVLLNTFVTKELGCLHISADPDEGSSWSLEHGPFAGMGALEDLALVSQASHAHVSSVGSSMSLLMRELVAYRAWTRRDNPQEPRKCTVWHGKQ
jgi:hypothetical protein